MLEDLKDASDNLCSALARYLSACSSIRSCSLRGGFIHNTPRKVAHQILREFVSLEGYHSQLQEAKLAIKVVYNNTRHISPISALPPEIMAHIFHLIPDSEPYTIDCLARVCSGWRTIALNSCSPWARIIYHPQGDLERLSKLLNYVQIHLSRSGQFPLHVNLDLDKIPEEWYSVPTVSLFPSIGARMQTLELNFVRHRPTTRIQADALRSLLLGSTRGLFTRLITRVYDSESDHFITALPGDNHDSPLSLDMTAEQLDKILASITVLHTRGIHPRWESTAYHNLVDLRLVSAGARPDRSPIAKSKLITILRASPHLRIFHFGMCISDRNSTTSGTDSVQTVPLVDLEILRIFGYANLVAHDNTESLLSLLAPGARPLRLFLDSTNKRKKLQLTDAITINETRAFLKRSNVVELRAHGHLLPTELLSLPTYLRVLVISGCHNGRYGTPIQENILQGNSSPQPELDTLYFIDCTLSLEDIWLRLQGTRVQRIVSHESIFYVEGKEVFGSAINDALSAVCPTIELASELPPFVSVWPSEEFYEGSA
ncbi:hypothetical protein FRC11_008217 [Ceratobasidium sp. 423]|nr:hypothetical protein FRC11_008217 [Ceratobasidium sp. 423]